ncbi:DUF350 domain-containing protein [Nocardia cyriacigeorgica]|jgi:hypothetical protein|uniref:DUF350 domain-containing protein n=1 Tax=Nocardia cyriacigeorgica TaxID=135487 RepID=UPI0002DBD5F2|nr:DUF350 domain-containing protein [Nocardia cyriacigeorgica]MBF6325648.1 DUF350 domain-containing protein [Nocardia cyriacigeorgica]MBF6344996.1 DUF350 domain-containing protein [Nocardia cyriacigeorgica]MBF6415668.1 DUF350 domain-containing protein [Nocardia cyriacigeorgica]TLF61189.1 DUF350 domain-containing protein [Nocardia cyriacigeorgica]
MTALALDSSYWSSLADGVGAILLYAVVGLVLMVIGFYGIDLTTPGRLRALVADGRPNAIVVTAAGMISMAFIVVLAIFSAGGRLLEGLIAAAVFGLVGIIAQIVSVRVVEKAIGIDIGAVMHADRFAIEALIVAAAHFALGLVVAFAIL